MRRRTERLFKKNRNDPVLAQAYREGRVDAAIIINQERNRFYKNKIGDLAGNPRETYKVINHLLDKDYGKVKFPNGESYDAVANDLKEFFENKVKTIYGEIEAELSQQEQVYSHPSPFPSCDSNFSSFAPISDEDLLKIISNMPNKQCSMDPITMNLFKACSQELLPVVSYIVNS